MKEKIIQIVRNIASASGDSLADVADIYEENYFKKEIDELSTLIQESNREAVEKFRSFCEDEVYEKRLSDEHYVLVSILIDAYLSSIGKEER